MTENNEEIKEMVNHPDHYNSHPSSLEAIEICRFMDFNLGNCIKYLWRLGHKDSETQELKKILWYLTDEVENYLVMGFFRKVFRRLSKCFNINSKRNIHSLCLAMSDRKISLAIVAIFQSEFMFGKNVIISLKEAQRLIKESIEERNGTI